MTSSFVLPSRVPWEMLRATDLEQCVYWLLDSMGARDLEWRVGGRGQGAADGGRDLTGSFYTPSPDGEITGQHWWLEVKGRAGTLESSSVKEAVLNAAGNSNVDVLVVITNTMFSNPTRDWVHNWQAAHPRPSVRLWDRHSLERMVSRHPSVVVRLFPSALSDHGVLELVRSEFWNMGFIAGDAQLRRLWRARNELDISGDALLALLASEAAARPSGDRRWAVLLTNEVLLSAIAHGVSNAVYHFVRAERSGSSFEFFREGMAAVLLVLLARGQASHVTSLIESVWSNDKRFVDAFEDVRNLSINAMIDLLEQQIHDICTSDCSRVSTDRYRLSETDIDRFWDRLLAPVDAPDDREPRSIFMMEWHEKACKVGFELDEVSSCPLCRDEPLELSSRLSMLERVITSRNPHRVSQTE